MCGVIKVIKEIGLVSVVVVVVSIIVISIINRCECLMLMFSVYVVLLFIFSKCICCISKVVVMSINIMMGVEGEVFVYVRLLSDLVFYKFVVSVVFKDVFSNSQVLKVISMVWMLILIIINWKVLILLCQVSS